ncbi:Hydrolase tropI [Colletotrichum viniferum]|nr:Hydrolase tropI [Colletotrichum viniferum]
MSTDKTPGYLAKPSGECCLKGTIHEGEARGSWEVIADVETYVSKPPTDKANGHIVLYFPDVWGMFVKGLLVMDAFADAGYLVLGLDYFRGDPVWKHRKDRNDTSNPGFDYEAWKRKHTAFADVAVPKWVDAVKQRYGTETTGFACVGYCFGAPYVCDELAKKTVTVGAFAHPAFLKEHHFLNLTKPLFMSCSEIDHTFDVPSRRRALDILQSEKKIYHYQLFSGVEHGFALRGDPKDPYQGWVKEQSLDGIVSDTNFPERQLKIKQAASMVPPRAFDFAGDVAIVTGAGSRMDGEIGNGRAAAILLARHGAKFALIDLNEDWARETKRMIDEEGGTSEIIQTDVSKEDSCRDAVSKTVELFGGVHILVNNAILFLASKEAGWITGLVMPVDGGTTAGRSDRPALMADGLAAENTGIDN